MFKLQPSSHPVAKVPVVLLRLLRVKTPAVVQASDHKPECEKKNDLQVIWEERNRTGVSEVAKDAGKGGRGEEADCFSLSCLQLITSFLFIFFKSHLTFHQMFPSDATKSWSSWVAIGRWHPAGSWRPLLGHEQPLACVSCSPFVNCTHRLYIEKKT